MASYYGHLSLSSLLGAAYGGFAAWQLELGWGPVFLGAGLTTLGGVLPDLDSDSSVPVRELFGVAAAVVPLFILRQLWGSGLTADEVMVVCAFSYLFIRYGLSALFKRLTVHRGMFHSIPAMFIAGLSVFLLDHGSELKVRLYLAGGTMLGFLSHLILDEIYSVNFLGLKFKMSKYAGSALKLFSASWVATFLTYALLIALALLAWRELGQAQ